MKKNLLSIFGLALAICCVVGYTSCSKLEINKCKTSDPYYCGSAKTCCKYQYYDGHHTCWETMSACRSSGYACETCHIED